jgi:hypothetical protein
VKYCACGRLIKIDAFKVCWKCYMNERVSKAYADGLAAGLNGSRRGSVEDGELTEKRIRALLQLCHPDKHNSSTLSTEATKWLLGQLERSKR